MKLTKGSGLLFLSASFLAGGATWWLRSFAKPEAAEVAVTSAVTRQASSSERPPPSVLAPGRPEPAGTASGAPDAVPAGKSLSAPTLSAEEAEVLSNHSPDELGQLIARAEDAYRKAGLRARLEAERRYVMLLNLAAKVQDAPSPPPDERELELQAQYREIEPTLDPAERAAFKEEFFREAHMEKRQEEGSR
jgi:hypothetical protein